MDSRKLKVDSRVCWLISMCQHDRDCHAAMLLQMQTGYEAVKWTFSKAANLLRAADMATSRYDGIRLQDVTDEFGCFIAHLREGDSIVHCSRMSSLFFT